MNHDAFAFLGQRNVGQTTKPSRIASTFDYTPFQKFLQLIHQRTNGECHQGSAQVHNFMLILRLISSYLSKAKDVASAVDSLSILYSDHKGMKRWLKRLLGHERSIGHR